MKILKDGEAEMMNRENTRRHLFTQHMLRVRRNLRMVGITAKDFADACRLAFAGISSLDKLKIKTKSSKTLSEAYWDINHENPQG